MVASCFLCNQEKQLVLFHRRQDAEIALQTLTVVIADIFLNHLNEALTVSKTLAVVPFPFENAPEAFHGTVVNTVSHTGHTLCHSRRFQLCMESAVCVLVTSIAVEQRMCIRISSNSRIEGVKHKCVIIAIPNNKCRNPSVIEIEDSAQIDLVYLNSFIPLEFRYIRKPLLIWLVCMNGLG